MRMAIRKATVEAGRFVEGGVVEDMQGDLKMLGEGVEEIWRVVEGGGAKRE